MNSPQKPQNIVTSTSSSLAVLSIVNAANDLSYSPLKIIQAAKTQ